MTNTPVFCRVTVIKLIHGWLATKKKRYHHGSFSSPKSLFCSDDEDSHHIFRCPHGECAIKRMAELDGLIKRLQRSTWEEVVTLIRIGICSVTNTHDIEVYRD